MLPMWTVGRDRGFPLAFSRPTLTLPCYALLRAADGVATLWRPSLPSTYGVCAEIQDTAVRDARLAPSPVLVISLLHADANARLASAVARGRCCLRGGSCSSAPSVLASMPNTSATNLS